MSGARRGGVPRLVVIVLVIVPGPIEDEDEDEDENESRGNATSPGSYSQSAAKVTPWTIRVWTRLIFSSSA
jgi:hypothetical protein